MFACKCLNILIHTENNDIQKVELDSLQLSDAEKSDAFFTKEVGRVIIDNISKEQVGLVMCRAVGPWTIHKCLNCNMDTHAVHRDRGASFVLISTNMLNGTSNISALRNSENYSSIFRVLINSDTDEQIDQNSMGGLPVCVALARCVSALDASLSEAVRREVAATEDRIRRFSDMHYQQLEHHRDKCHHHHQALLRQVLKSQPTEEVSVVPSGLSSMSATPSQVAGGGDASLQSPSPKTSLSKPKHPVVTNLTRTKRPVSRQLSTPMERLESLDAGLLFPLDGMDDSPTHTHSDIEDSDTDDSTSHDEGIHIPRGRSASVSMAKSLPIHIPVFMSAIAHDIPEHKDHLKSKEDSVDIAASIKALAKSVHGDAVFGDLPKPRYSMQI